MNKLPKSPAAIKTCMGRQGARLVKVKRTDSIFELLPTTNKTEFST